MAQNLGATKKLVPALNPETRCPAELREDDGLVLEVDCSNCEGAHDLANRTCLSGIIHSITGGPRPDAIILKSFMHKRYRGEDVRLACAVASELSALKMAIDSLDVPSDRRCRTCAASRRSVLCSAMRILLENPSGYLTDRIAVREQLLRDLTSSPSCPDSRSCFKDALSVSLLARA